ncbi:MAG: DUF6164 family protein [Candidatus Thiodiazotropha sp.]
MARLLFKLNGVPDDEAEDIRRILEEGGIEYYETSAGRWGISLAAIWLRDEVQLEQASTLIERYQKERYQHARDEYERLKREGKLESHFDRLRKEPIRVFIYLLAILAVLYFSILPFIHLAKH